MHVLISAGFNPLKSIEISCSVSEEGLLKDKMKVCISEVKKGKSLYEAMSKADIFKIDFLSAIKVGEESGNLKDTIKEVLDIMESDVVENYKKAVQCIEPILIIIIGLFITQIVFAFLLPAISIMDSLGNQI
jgi:type II secretory pathway component PulF